MDGRESQCKQATPTQRPELLECIKDGIRVLNPADVTEDTDLLGIFLKNVPQEKPFPWFWRRAVSWLSDEKTQGGAQALQRSFQVLRPKYFLQDL